MHPHGHFCRIDILIEDFLKTGNVCVVIGSGPEIVTIHHTELSRGYHYGTNYYVRGKGIARTDKEGVISCLPHIKIEVRYEDSAQHVYLGGEDLGDRIREPEISMYASSVSAIPEVRAFLLDTQRDIAKKNSVIMDGRDIGTVILPDADLKIFLTASEECRAKRRYDELIARGQNVKFEDVLAEMNQRDKQDSTRDVAPTAAADDAILLDNTYMTFDQTVDKVIELAKQCK